VIHPNGGWWQSSFGHPTPLLFSEEKNNDIQSSLTAVASMNIGQWEEKLSFFIFA
jgi:hypothetical protein